MKLWRLIVFIVVFAIFLLFIVFNLQNTCNISFGFVVLENVPVFLTVFVSFVVGLLFAFPFVLGFAVRKKKAKSVQGKGLLAKVSGKQEDTGFVDKTNYGID